MNYSIVIATLDRPAELGTTLESIAAQTAPASRVIVVDASSTGATRALVEGLSGRLPVIYERAERPSSAAQRNQGARRVETPLIAFVDDDVDLPPSTFAKLGAVFAADTQAEIGGVAGRIKGLEHPVPRGFTRWYYRFQAGYAHPTYGGKLFGPAINCLPSYTENEGEVVAAEWLNSTCVLYRTGLFLREEFPDFEGYSFLEDVHLSARIARTHRLYFHCDARYEHRDAPSTFKRDLRAMMRMRFHNQRLVARDIMGVRQPELAMKLLLHRIFASMATLRHGSREWRDILIGTWT